MDIDFHLHDHLQRFSVQERLIPLLVVTLSFFGFLMTMCLSIGTMTPPLGTVMYVICYIGDISVEHYVRVIPPYLAVLIVVVLPVRFFSSLVAALAGFLMD